jgi:hypothetical protein
MRATILTSFSSGGDQRVGTMSTSGPATPSGSRRRTGRRAVTAGCLLFGFVYAIEGSVVRAMFFIGVAVASLLVFERPTASPSARLPGSPSRSAGASSGSRRAPASADDPGGPDHGRTKRVDDAARSAGAYGTLEISRRAGGADRLRGYRIVIDGVKHGKLRQGESREFALTRGLHEVCLVIDWARTPPLVVDMTGRDRVAVTCWSKPMSERRVASRDAWIGLALSDPPS